MYKIPKPSQKLKEKTLKTLSTIFVAKQISQLHVYTCISNNLNCSTVHDQKLKVTFVLNLISQTQSYSQVSCWSSYFKLKSHCIKPFKMKVTAHEFFYIVFNNVGYLYQAKLAIFIFWLRSPRNHLPNTIKSNLVCGTVITLKVHISF